MNESPADAYADLLRVEADGWALWNPYHEGVVGDCGLLTGGRFFKASLARSPDGDIALKLFYAAVALQCLPGPGRPALNPCSHRRRVQA